MVRSVTLITTTSFGLRLCPVYIVYRDTKKPMSFVKNHSMFMANFIEIVPVL